MMPNGRMESRNRLTFDLTEASSWTLTLFGVAGRVKAMVIAVTDLGVFVARNAERRQAGSPPVRSKNPERVEIRYVVWQIGRTGDWNRGHR